MLGPEHILTLLYWLVPLILLIVAILIAVVVAGSSPYPEVKVFESEKTFIDACTGSGEKIRQSFPTADEGSIDLSIVVPAYNEEARLPIMLDSVVRYMEDESFRANAKIDSYEIVVVDDGSTDATTKVALTYSSKLTAEKCRVLTLARNLGKGGAVRRGVMVSRGRNVLFADADGATDFSELLKLLEKLNDIKSEDKHGLVCGSRAHLEKESVAKRSLFRTFLMLGFHLCVWTFGCKSIKDTQCGFKLMTARTARITFASLHIERWAFDVELLKLAEHFRIPMAEVAVTWKEIEGSKLNPIFASVQMFKDIFLLWLRYAVGAWKVVEKIE